MEYLFAENGKAKFEVTLEQGDFFIAFKEKERLVVEALLIAIAKFYNDIEMTKLFNRVRISHNKGEEH